MNTKALTQAIQEATPCGLPFSGDLPLIYRWQIRKGDEVVGTYVGKAKGGTKRPLKAYLKNVTKLLSGKPYQKDNPAGFRKVHRALAQACQEGLKIELVFLGNSPAESLDADERFWIEYHDCDGTQPWQLNQTKKG